MKKIILFLLLPAFASGQDSLLLTGTIIGEAEYLAWSNTAFLPTVAPYNHRQDCEYWEKTSDWKAENIGSAHCLHEWVMAAHGEVNDISLYLVDDLVYRPCGRDGRENFARICARCLRHETCTKTWGWDAVVPEKSEYQKLLEKIQR